MWDLPPAGAGLNPQTGLRLQGAKPVSAESPFFLVVLEDGGLKWPRKLSRPGNTLSQKALVL